MALSRVVSEIFNVEKCRNLEIGVRGHSRKGPSIRNVGDACERSQVSRRATVKNSVTKHGDIVLYALRYPQLKADKRISDVIGALQMEVQLCRRVQHRLESAQEVG